MAWTSASSRSAAIESAMHPEPVPTSTIDRRLDVPHEIEGHLHEQLRLGAGDEDGGGDEEVVLPEGLGPEDVLQGLAGRAPPDERAKAFRLGPGNHVTGAGEQRRPVPAQDVTEEALGVPLRGVDSRGREDPGRLGDEGGGGHGAALRPPTWP